MVVENDKKLLIRSDTELVNESSPIKQGIFSEVCNKVLISRYQCQVHSWTISFGLSMEWIGLQSSQWKVGKVAINYMEGTQESFWTEIGTMTWCQGTAWEFLAFFVGQVFTSLLCTSETTVSQFWVLFFFWLIFSSSCWMHLVIL